MVRHARRVTTLGERVDSLEQRYGPPPDDDGDRRTVGDLLALYPDLAEPLRVLWQRRHAAHGDLQAAAAAETIWRRVSGGPSEGASGRPVSV